MTDLKEQPSKNDQTSRTGRRRGRRSNKEKAEAQFDSSAAPKTLEKFFSEVIDQDRENVDIELHLDIDERLIDGYDDKIETYIELQPYDDDKSDKMSNARVQDLSAMSNLAIAKKLWSATPESERTSVDHLKYLRNYTVDLPKAMNIAIDHLGKVTDDEWICRIRWNSLTIERFIIRSLQQASKDPDFANVYLTNITNKEEFQSLDVGRIINSSEDSVLWLRDYAEQALDNIMTREFTVKIGDGNDEIAVCLPQLRFTDDDNVDRANIIIWMNKINVNYPQWKFAINAAILRMINAQWIEQRNVKLKDLDPIFDGSLWKNLTIHDIFNDMNLTHMKDVEGLKLRDQSSSFLFYYQKKSLPLLKRVFNMSTANQSSSFGSKAQLINMEAKNFEYRTKKNRKLLLVKNAPEGSSFFRLKDKSSIVHQMIFGFTRKVRVQENYKYRLNGSPESIKSSNSFSDSRE